MRAAVLEDGHLIPTSDHDDAPLGAPIRYVQPEDLTVCKVGFSQRR
jgi:hypothetical protein